MFGHGTPTVRERTGSPQYKRRYTSFGRHLIRHFDKWIRSDPDRIDSAQALAFGTWLADGAAGVTRDRKRWAAAPSTLGASAEGVLRPGFTLSTLPKEGWQPSLRFAKDLNDVATIIRRHASVSGTSILTR